MGGTNSNRKNYILASLVGAIGGGLVVAVATRAIPRMMTRIMCGMMSNMMAQVGNDSQDPEEM